MEKLSSNCCFFKGQRLSPNHLKSIVLQRKTPLSVILPFCKSLNQHLPALLSVLSRHFCSFTGSFLLFLVVSVLTKAVSVRFWPFLFVSGCFLQFPAVYCRFCYHTGRFFFFFFFFVPGHFFLFLAVSVITQAMLLFLAVSGLFWLFLVVSGRPQKAAKGKFALSFQSFVSIFCSCNKADSGRTLVRTSTVTKRRSVSDWQIKT